MKGILIVPVVYIATWFAMYLSIAGVDFSYAKSYFYLGWFGGGEIPTVINLVAIFASAVYAFLATISKLAAIAGRRIFVDMPLKVQTFRLFIMSVSTLGIFIVASQLMKLHSGVLVIPVCVSIWAIFFPLARMRCPNCSVRIVRLGYAPNLVAYLFLWVAKEKCWNCGEELK